jgi:hypothetical protein
MRRLIVILLGFLCFNLLRGQGSSRSELWYDGVNFMKEGDYLRGFEKMNQYLALSPYDPNALFNRGNCLVNLGDRNGGCHDLLNAKAYGLKKFGKNIQYNCSPEFLVNRLKKQFYKGVPIYPELGYRPKYTRSDTLRGELRPERTCYDVYFYNLTVRVHPIKKEIEGINEIWFKGVSESNEIQIEIGRAHV